MNLFPNFIRKIYVAILCYVNCYNNLSAQEKRNEIILVSRYVADESKMLLAFLSLVSVSIADQLTVREM